MLSSPQTLCHVSHVRCQVSGVTCHLSSVTCHLSFKFFIRFQFQFFFNPTNTMDKVVELAGGGSVINRAYPVWFLSMDSGCTYQKIYIFMFLNYILIRKYHPNVRTMRLISDQPAGHGAQNQPKYLKKGLKILYAVFS